MAAPKIYTAQIIGRREIAQDTLEIECRVPEDFMFTAGQYVWLILPTLNYEDPRGSRRAFSIASSPLRKGVITMAFRVSESGFKRTLRELSLPSEVQVAGPFGHLSLPSEDRPVVMVAGGIGITPFLSMIRYAIETSRPLSIVLVYSNTSPARVAYADVLSELQARNEHLTVSHHTGAIEPKCLFDVTPDMRRAEWFVVGPQDMSIEVGNFLQTEGVPSKQLHFEEFYPARKDSAEQDRLISAGADVFKTAVERSSSHIIITNTDGRILFANDGAEAITQFSHSELLGQTPRLWGGLMSLEFYQDMWQTIKGEHKVFRGEVRNRRKNGEEYYAMTHISPIISMDDELIGFIGTEEDITNQKDTQRRLEHREAQDLAIISSIGEGLVVMDNDGRIIMINKAFEELMQFTETDVRGRFALDVIRREDEAGNDIVGRAEAFAKVRAGDGGYEILPEQNQYFVRKDKTRFPIALKVSPFFAKSAVVGTVAVFRDVTREKELEKMRVDFLSLASHQLRTPLSGTKWLIETLQRETLGPLTDKQRVYLGDLYESNERMIKLASDILSVVRLESAAAAVEKKNLLVEDILENIRKQMDSVAKSAKISLRVTSAVEASRTVHTNEDMLMNILESLIFNAINYSPAGKEVAVSAFGGDGDVIFSVQDSGIGIPAEEKQHIFGRFYRASNAKHMRPAGTGLGLYLVSVLAKRISATVWFDSEENKGTTFFVRLHSGEIL